MGFTQRTTHVGGEGAEEAEEAVVGKESTQLGAQEWLMKETFG